MAAGQRPPIPPKVVSGLFECAWRDQPDALVRLLEPYASSLGLAQEQCRRWLPTPLEPGDSLPSRLPDGSPYPEAPTPWPREYSPVPGVDLPVSKVLSVSWNAIMDACGIVTATPWTAEFDSMTSHLGIPGAKLGKIRHAWSKACHPLVCVRAASPRETLLSPRDVDEFQRVFQDGYSDAHKRRALKILVLAGLEPVVAWNFLKTFTSRTRELPTGRWLPLLPDAEEADRVYTFAARLMPEEAVQTVLEMLPDRKVEATLALSRLAGFSEARARLTIELILGEMVRVGATGVGETRSLARISVDLEIRELMAARPFHWAVLATTILVEDGAVETMAVGRTVEGRIALFFSPAFVNSISSEEVRGVLVHEINHVILGHLRPCPGPVSKEATLRTLAKHDVAWTIACEVTANEYVPYRLPCVPFTIDQYGLPPAESTYKRYRRLCRKALEIEKPKDRILTVLAKSPRHHNDSVDGRCSGEIDPMRIAAAMVGSEVDKATLQMAGNESLGIAEEISPAERPELRWNQVLRMWARGALQRHATRTYPSRRQPNRIGVVPGRRRSRSWRHLMVVIDTSGSMDPIELSQVLAELKALQAMGAKIALVHCDSSIQKEGWLGRNEDVRQVHGRGGTSLKPPFAPQVLEKYTPDLIVYFTDGAGLAPERPPDRIGVLWILTGRTPVVPARWGRVVCMRSALFRMPIRESPPAAQEPKEEDGQE